MQRKRLLSIFLTLCMLLGMVPSLVFASSGESGSSDEVIRIEPFIDTDDSDNPGEDIYNMYASQTTIPVSEEGLVTPYGSRPVTLIESAELFTFNSNGNSVSTKINDLSSAMYYHEVGVSSSNVKSLSYAQGVSFDPTGCGRNNYIAVLGFHNADNQADRAVYVYVFNGDTGALTCEFSFNKGSEFWWLRGDGSVLDSVDAANFFQITAGDYDNDGKDTLVVYDATSSLRELKVNISDTGKVTTSTNSSLITSSTPYFNTTYMDYRMYNSGINYRLCVSLDSGDVNGDGIDDLVVVSCTGDVPDAAAYKNAKNESCKATLAVGFGKTGGSLNQATVKTSTIYDSSTSMTVAAPGVSIGDIDGDGDNEIVVAGFLNKSTEKDRVNLQKGKVGFTYYEAVGTSIKQTGGLQTLTEISAISKGDSLRTNERLWQQFSVECVSFAGTGQKAYIFLNGWVYQMEKVNGTLTPKKVSVAGSATLGGAEPFSKLTTEIKSLDKKYDINEVYIMSASRANFSGDTSGKESLLLTVGYHVNPDKNKDTYFVGQVMITANDDGSLQSLYVLDGKTNNAELSDGVSFATDYAKMTGANNFSYLRVATDIDYDSLVVKYDHTEAFYTDPTVVAFLQAAPYYSELDAGNSSTTYSYTEGYEQSTTEGFDIAVGFGLAAEVETSFVKFETEEEWRTSLTEEFTTSTAVEYTTTFEANDQNQVILRRTAMYTYYYSVLAADGSFTDAGENNQDLLAITVPKYPVVSALSVDQYNAYVDTYNEKCSGYTSGQSWVSWVDTVQAEYGKDATEIFFGSSSMKTITPELMEKYYLNNEGDPFNYASDVGDYLNGFSMVKDNTWVTLSWASGTISQEMNTSLTTEQSTSTSIGVSVSMRLMGGASFAGNGAWAGVTASLESSVTNTRTTSKILSTGTSGTVQGLSADQSAYGFDWQLIGWRTEAGDNLFPGVIFVGYAVQNVQAPPKPVDDLHVTYPYIVDGEIQDGKALLTWTCPTRSTVETAYARTPIESFSVYLNDTKVGTVASTGEGNTITYVVDVSTSDSALAKLHVKSCGNGVYSVPSNIAECVIALDAQQVQLLIDQAIARLEAKIETLEFATKEELSAAIIELTEAYQTADALLKTYADELADELLQKLTVLESSMSRAEQALQASIEQVQNNLDKAVADLNDAIAAGDKENADALAEAVAELTAAYQAADALLKADIDSLSGELTDLKTALKDADLVLQKAIDLVQENLDKAVADLNDAIAAGDKENADALAEAVAELTAVYQAADSLLKADIDSLSGELTDLKATMKDANQILQEAIGLVQDNLDSAIEKLQDSIAAGNQESAAALTQAIAALTRAYQAADSMLKAEIDELSNQLDTFYAATSEGYQAADALLKAENDALRSELNELKDSLSALTSQVEMQNTKFTGEIDSLSSANQEQMDDLNHAQTFAIIGLSVSCISLLANIGLILYTLLRRKKLPIA